MKHEIMNPDLKSISKSKTKPAHKKDKKDNARKITEYLRPKLERKFEQCQALVQDTAKSGPLNLDTGSLSYLVISRADLLIGWMGQQVAGWTSSINV